MSILYSSIGGICCRAPDSGATCALPNGSRTGAELGYTNEGQQGGWQNTLAGTPTTTAQYAYDGEGHRVASNVQSNGVTTSTTDYLAGGLEEVTTAGSTTTLTKYEAVPGVCNVVIVGSGPSETVSYVTTDGLGSVSEALDSSGNVTAQQLFGPYGTGRFALGAMPTSKGYTGQYGDATTGLDYYGARYYDPLVGQFTSADTAGDGLNGYAYVHDDPETATDPTGQRCSADGVCPGAGGVGGSGGCGQCGKSPCAPNCSPPKQPPTGPTNPGNPSGGPPKKVYDKNGKCADALTCEDVKNAEVNKLQGEYARDSVIGTVILFVADLLRLKLDDTDVAAEIKDALDFVTQIAAFLPLMVSALEFMGVVHNMDGLANSIANMADRAAGVLRGFQSAMQGVWGAVNLIGGAIGALMNGLTGPVGAVLQIGMQFVGNAIVNAGSVFAYHMLMQANAELAQANTIAGEDTYQWCTSTPGACGHVTNW